MPPDRIHHHRRRIASHACSAACDATSFELVSTIGVKSSDGAHWLSFWYSLWHSFSAGECANAGNLPMQAKGSAGAPAENPRRRNRFRPAPSHAAAAARPRFRAERLLTIGCTDLACVDLYCMTAGQSENRGQESGAIGCGGREGMDCRRCSRDRRASWRRCVSRRGIRRRGSMLVGARRGGEGRVERMVLRGAQQPRTIHWRLRSMENAAENVSVYI